MNDDSDWVFDCLIGFLQSDIWNIPIMEFIETESVVFDEDSDPKRYESLFNEYTHLIDRLLSAHCSDFEITESQFENACQLSKIKLNAALRQSLFQQIWAAEDYDTFVRMMRETNIALQLQALHIMAQKGVVYESFTEVFDYNKNIEEALKRSLGKDETETESSVEKDNAVNVEDNDIKEEIEIHENKELENDQSNDESKDIKEEEKIEIKNIIPESEIKVIASEIKDVKDLQLNEISKIINVETDEKTKNPIEILKKNDDPSVSAEIQKRSEYMKSQRDKLIELKRREREKKLSKMDMRPKSAKTLKASLNKESDDSESTSLAFRKSLAQRLKSEVIDK